VESINKIMFVCTGNTCRSPIAEGLMKSKFKDRKIDIVSRGLMVLCSEPANAMAIEIMADMGIDISMHRSKPFDEDELDDATLVLTMTGRHKAVLSQRIHKGKLFSIKEFVGETGDVNDPYGGTIDVYKLCYDELEQLILKIGGLLK